MARISLKEQYDNQSVIKQIVDLTDEIGEYDEAIDHATQAAEDALTIAENAKTEADAVKGVADNALTVASDAKTAADAATTKNEEQDTELAEIDTKLTELGNKDAEQDTEIAALKTKDTEQDAAIEAVKETADNSLADVTIQTDAVSASLLLKNNLAAESSKAVPLASETATGMMTKATYLALANAQDRIAALEGKTIVVYVTFSSDDPSQEEITNLFEAKAGKAPVGGNQAIDIARSLAYQYSGEDWIKTTQEVGQWSNTAAGIVKGTPAGTENAGTIFAETDGTGSVNGWDDLVARVANNESAISTTIPSTYATKVALDATDANVANIKTTADAAATKNEEQDTEIAAIKNKNAEQDQEIDSLEQVIAATEAEAQLCYKDAALSDDQSKLVLTRTNGQKTEIVLPSRTSTVCPTLFTTITADLTAYPGYLSKTGVILSAKNGSLVGNIGDKFYDIYTSKEKTHGGYGIFGAINNFQAIFESFVTQLHNSIGFADGTYMVSPRPTEVLVLAYTNDIGTTADPTVRFTVADGEITSVAVLSGSDTAAHVLMTGTLGVTTPTFGIPDSDPITKLLT